jgi:hypothetical protein
MLHQILLGVEGLQTGLSDVQTGLSNEMQAGLVENCIHLVDTITMRLQNKLAGSSSVMQFPPSLPKPPKKRSRKTKDSGTEISSPFKSLLMEMNDNVRQLEIVIDQGISKLVSHHTQQLNKSKTLSDVVQGSSVTSEQYNSLCDEIHNTVESWFAVNLNQSTDGTGELRKRMTSAMKHFFVANLNGGEKEA